WRASANFTATGASQTRAPGWPCTWSSRGWSTAHDDTPNPIVPAVPMNLEKLLDPVREIATEAGAVIMDVYRQPFEVDEKSDGSPVTLADRGAHDVIARALADLTPDLPLLSEESAPGAAVGRRGWRRFWLVDPLDGTREFVNRNGEFTVNIALIDDGVPVLGVVHTPARDLTHAAARGAGAERSE